MAVAAPTQNKRRLLAIGECTWIVGQYHRMRRTAEREVVEDTFLRHQSHNEIQRRFIVLNAILERRIRAFQLFFEADAVRTKDGLDDLHHAFILKNHAVARERQQP